jgi:hypothetical protein
LRRKLGGLGDYIWWWWWWWSSSSSHPGDEVIPEEGSKIYKSYYSILELVELSNTVDMGTWQRALVSRSSDSSHTLTQEHNCGSSTWWPTWKTGLAWRFDELRGFCGQSKCHNLFSDSVIHLRVHAQPHMAQQTRKCVRSLVGKHWTIYHTFRIWHPTIFISFHLWRSTGQDVFSPSTIFFTFDEDVKPATTTWLTQQGHAFHAFGMDKLIIRFGKWFNCQGDSVEKYRTCDSFTLQCQLSLLKSCLWYVDTVNLLCHPLSYVLFYKLHANWSTNL